MELGAITGQTESKESQLTLNGKDLEVALSEQAVRAHILGLRCDYCREQLVRMAEAGLQLYVGERPDVDSIPRDEVTIAHDENHKTWHAWNDQVKVAKQAIRAQENKVYSELKAKGLRGAALKEEAKKVLAKQPKIEIPKLPELKVSYVKVERPAKEIKPKRVAKNPEDAAKAARRQASVNRTLELLAKLGDKGSL